MGKTFRMIFMRSSAVVLILLSAFAAAADTLVSSDVQLYLPPSALDQYIATTLTNYSGSSQFSIPSMTVQSQLPVQLSGIQASVQYVLAQPKVVQPGFQWSVQTSSLAATVQIGQIAINQDVTQAVGGVLVHVHVQATCSNVVLTLPAGQGAVSSQIQAQIANGSLTMKANSLQAQWSPQNWQIQIGSCSGASGLSSLIRSQAQSTLSNQPLVDSQILQALQQQLNQLAQIGNALRTQQNFKTGFPTVAAWLAPQTVSETQDHVTQVLGQVLFYFANPQPYRALRVQFATPPSAAPLGTQSGLILPANVVQALAGAAQDNWLFTYQSIANNFSGFQNLLESYFDEFFVWPDLMNYSSSTKFPLEIWTTQAPTMQWENTTTPMLQLQVQLGAELSITHGQSQINYVRFNTPLTCEAAISVVNQQMQAEILHPQGLKLTDVFDPQYVEENQPNQAIDDSTIANALSSSLQQKIFSIPAPSVHIGSRLVLGPQTPIISGQQMLIPLSQVQ